MENAREPQKTGNFHRHINMSVSNSNLSAQKVDVLHPKVNWNC